VQNRWFANRGQILQTAVATFAASIAFLNAWPNIKDDQLFTFGPILFAMLIVLTAITGFAPSVAAMLNVPRRGSTKMGPIIVMIAGLAVFALGTVWYYVEIPIKDAPSPAKTSARGPTLEATNKSVIDATGATIPGDLPFQFGKADNNSLIAMPGMQVTKTESGWQVTAGKANLEFPIPPEKYAIMPMSELRDELKTTARELRQFQENFTADFRRTLSDREKTKEVLETYRISYESKFSDLSFSLASAALSRIGSLSEIPNSAASGGQIVYYKKFVGPTPAGDAAAFLELLSTKLPK
jgi:hypothetical protein